MILDVNGNEAGKGQRSTCPVCGGVILAKVGQIVAPHWAHVAADCDAWAEPESEWHRSWKRWLRDEKNATIEAPMTPHRADAVLPDGRVVELQSRYQSPELIAEREAFYGDMLWIYRCTWTERLHWGRRGFWWKHGSKSMALHQRPVWWDMGGELWRVRLSVVDSGSDLWPSSGKRVLGQVIEMKKHSCGFAGRSAA